MYLRGLFYPRGCDAAARCRRGAIKAAAVAGAARAAHKTATASAAAAGGRVGAAADEIGGRGLDTPAHQHITPRPLGLRRPPFPHGSGGGKGGGKRGGLGGGVGVAGRGRVAKFTTAILCRGHQASILDAWNIKGHGNRPVVNTLRIVALYHTLQLSRHTLVDYPLAQCP